MADRPLAPRGGIEPHAGMLNAPAADQLLYKMMTVDNLLRSIRDGYLHFNRVDHYTDFPGADPNDGVQLPRDLSGNEGVRFEKAPEFSAADYYARSRSRTYACCFSVENSEFIWANYANGCTKGKVCIVFEFGKLRETLKGILQAENTALLYNGAQCRQIFDINYGTVSYVDWESHQGNIPYLPNPLAYTYLKGKAFAEEKELRISLSALGMGHFGMADGRIMEFPPSLQMGFDFRAAMANGTIRQVLRSSDCDGAFLQTEMEKFGIAPAPGSDSP